MRIDGLSLDFFRNYVHLDAAFDPNINVIYGDNAQGKTNLLEAVAYLSGVSHRARYDRELIQFGVDHAFLKGNVFARERDFLLEAELHRGARRVLRSNGVKLKNGGELSGIFQSVLFCPEDLMILKMGASQRRRFGDLALCALRPNYDAALTEYNRILEQKSRILKDHFENPGILEILPEYNTRLCQVGALLISYRARFYDSLGKAAASYHNQFSGGAENFTLSYKTVSTVIDPFAPVPELTQNLLDHLQSHSRAELETAQCLTGPHKDDFTVSLSGIDLKAYGSQGQTRTAAISLKLAQRELMAREWGEEPVLLLDDVLSELDPGRQDFVLNKIVSGQVFITCCEPGRFTKLGRTIQVENGNIRE